MTGAFTFDWDRASRTGLPEVVLAEFKTPAHVREIAEAAVARSHPLLMTRLRKRHRRALDGLPFDLDPLARTAAFRAPDVPDDAPLVAIVTAGTSDAAVASETRVTASFLGLRTLGVADVGVAALWRLEARLAEIREAQVVIAVAGMEGALFSVLPGLVRAPVIAVPTSVGYGVGAAGRAALRSALSTCSAGLTVVNIDNGFGAAAAALRMVRAVPA